MLESCLLDPFSDPLRTSILRLVDSTPKDGMVSRCLRWYCACGATVPVHLCHVINKYLNRDEEYMSFCITVSTVMEFNAT